MGPIGRTTLVSVWESTWASRCYKHDDYFEEQQSKHWTMNFPMELHGTTLIYIHPGPSLLWSNKVVLVVTLRGPCLLDFISVMYVYYGMIIVPEKFPPPVGSRQRVIDYY